MSRIIKSAREEKKAPDISPRTVKSEVVKVLKKMTELKKPLEKFYGRDLDIANRDGQYMGILTAWVESVRKGDIKEAPLL